MEVNCCQILKLNVNWVEGFLTQRNETQRVFLGGLGRRVEVVLGVHGVLRSSGRAQG